MNFFSPSVFGLVLSFSGASLPADAGSAERALIFGEFLFDFFGQEICPNFFFAL